MVLSKLIWSGECGSIYEARKIENQLKRQGRGSGFYRMIGLTPPQALGLAYVFKPTVGIRRKSTVCG